MAYPSDEQIQQLDAKVTPVAADLVVLGDSADAVRTAKKVTFADFMTAAAAYITNNIGGFVNSVTGLDTDNTDPQNPIVKISVDGVTILGLGTPGSPLSAIGGGGGGGGGGGTKLAIDTTTVPITGDTAEHVLYSIPIPANTLGTNDAISFMVALEENTTNSNAAIRVKYGSTTLATYSTSIAGGNPKTTISGVIIADGATNAQKFQSIYERQTTNTIIQNTFSEISTGVLNLEITAQLGNSADSITAEEIIVEEISAKGVKTIKVNVPTADVLQLNSIPFQLIPAPSAGKAIDVISAVGRIIFNSVAYTTNLNLQITVGGTPLFANSALLADTATTIRKFVNTTATLVDATACELTVQTGDPLAGDSDIDIYLVYQEIDL